MGQHGFTLVPWGLGPDAVPRVTAIETARASPELAVLSVLTHGGERDAGTMALAALAGVAALDAERATAYYGFVMRALGPAARSALEDMMSSGKYDLVTEFQRKHFAAGEDKGREVGFREGIEKGIEKGVAQGTAQALLKILTRRSLPISQQQRMMIESCNDPSTLQRWIDRSFDVATVDELLG